MSRHSLPPQRRSRRVVAGAGIGLGLAVVGSGVAVADPAPQDAGAPADPADPVNAAPLPADADGLFDRLQEVSRQAQETSDRIVENNAAIEDAKARLDEANRAVDANKGRADRARAAADEARIPVSELSQAMYRGATVDRVTAVAGAADPQDAIDRRAYVTAINDDRTSKVEALRNQLQDAADAQSLALRSKATADFQVADLAAKQKGLDDRNAQLDGLKNEITTAVDGLSPDQKQRWVDRNGPIDVDVDEFLGRLSDAADAVSSIGGGVVGAAMSKLGAPYSWGAVGPDAFDCSGLMYWAYQQMGKSIPRTSQAQVAGGTPVSRDELQPGDIVGYYPGVTHVGMYIGDGKVVHASDYGIPVQVVSVDSMPFAGAARY
ncbi:NlpC/P60 family protein [Corynebacterium nuruki]|uniref:NlpC/P60 family protein n=1 Tax=Corynebacterium nuruki TaxID=1032851 RepID=UPI0023557AF4